MRGCADGVKRGDDERGVSESADDGRIVNDWRCVNDWRDVNDWRGVSDGDV